MAPLGGELPPPNKSYSSGEDAAERGDYEPLGLASPLSVIRIYCVLQYQLLRGMTAPPLGEPL